MENVKRMNKASEVSLLTFDSELFGFTVGRCSLSEQADLSLLKRNIVRQKVKLIYLFSQQSLNIIDIENNLDVSVSYSDEKVIFSKNILNNDSYYSHLNIQTNVWHDSSLQSLYALAKASGEHSRFFLDTRIERVKADKLYSLWLEKSLNFDIADEIYISGIQKPTGLLTVKFQNDAAYVGLLAVDVAHRGKGLARDLLLHMEMQCSERNTIQIVVPTQRVNNDACNFYRKSGYIEKESSFIYHCWSQNA
jgi:dTDP-4-amino-4,6-dideoxy-D-galactose acyltransferase